MLLFSFAVTHTFNLRYAVAATLGLAILASRLVAAARWATAVSCFLVLVAIGVMLNAGIRLPSEDPLDRALALVDRAPQNLYIVTGNGQRFFEIREGAAAAVADRLVYLKSPAEIVNPDPTNEHQIGRWKAIGPDLAVMDIAAFVESHSRFLLFGDAVAVDLLPGLLIRRGYTLRVIARNGDAYLSEVETSTAVR
jgi:hypothetical protein